MIMANCISVINSKGGAGKTTTTVNLAAALANTGKRVLLVDFDPQCSASDWLGFNDAESQSHLLDSMLGTADITDGIHDTYLENLHLLPNSMHLFQAETLLANEVANDTLLSIALEPIQSQYDFILMDCTPTMGVMAYNAIFAAKNLLIPVETSFISMRSIRSIMKVIDLMKTRRDPQINIIGLLPSRMDSRQTSCNQAIAMMKEHFSSLLLETCINDAVAIKDSVSFGQSVLCYKPKSKSAQQYKQLAQEVISRLETRKKSHAA